MLVYDVIVFTCSHFVSNADSQSCMTKWLKMTPGVKLSARGIQDVVMSFKALKIDETNVKETNNLPFLSATLGGRHKASKFVACVCK